MKLPKNKNTVISLIPIVVLMALLALNISIFGSDSILGASQVVLIFSSGICVWLAMWLFKTPWAAFEDAIRSNISSVTSALIILFMIGAVSGTWMMSGIVPSLIYYGVKIISPKVFLVTACALCAFVSVIIGSSWTTIATIGMALMGIGSAQGFSPGVIAGAIISGAYFGDKISPLSDTTVMASSVCDVPLFDHIKYMMVTTVPSFAITLVIFLVLGLTHECTDASQISVYTNTLASTFRITPWVLVIPVLTGVMIARKMPAMVVLGLSILLAAIASVIFQPHIIMGIGSETSSLAQDASRATVMFAGVVRTAYDTLTLDTGVDAVNSLVASRGMLGMLNTVFLIICAMCFGGCMKASGMLFNLASLLLPCTKTRTGLVTSTVATGFALNGIVSDQYLSIILTADIYKDIYKESGYEGRLLSRSVEDSSTITSPLFPWSSCGMTQATILSVPTLTYLPFCFFNYIGPLMSIVVAMLGYRINCGKSEKTLKK